MSFRNFVRDAFRYGLVGVVNTLVGFSIIIGLEQGFGVNPYLANAGGYAVGVMVSFVLKRRYVFGKGRSVREAGPRYLASVLFSFALNQGVLFLAHAVLPEGPLAEITAQLSGMCVYTVVLFLLSRYWVFPAARVAA